MRTKIATKNPLRKTQRIRRAAKIVRGRQRRLSSNIHNKNNNICKSQRSNVVNGAGRKVADKLEALKNLINPNGGGGGGEMVKSEELFKETADYIVMLRTQVAILQKLIHFYGSAVDNNINNSDDDALGNVISS
ncbi:hypothetical protein ACFE04_009108 [Oxalis oulophora]